MNIRVSLAITAIMAASILAWQPCYANAGKETAIRLSITPFIDTTMPVVGMKRGFFSKHGIELKLFDTTWAGQFDMLAGGAIDVGMATLDELVTKDVGLQAVGRQIDYILPAWQFLGLSFFANTKAGVLPLDELKEKYPEKEAVNKFLDQLVGKKIVYPQGSLFEQAFSRFVTNAGRKLNEFSVVNSEAEAGLNGLEDSSVAMAAVGSQQFAEANRRGYRTAISPRDLGLVVITGFVARKSFKESNPEAVTNFVCAWYETVRWVADHPQETYNIINEYMTARGSTPITYQEFLDLRQLNLISNTPEAMRAQFLEKESPAYWKITWDRTVETMRETGKGDFIPRNTSSFIVPWTFERATTACPSP